MNFKIKVMAGACALALGQLAGEASAAVPSLTNCDGPAFGSAAAVTAGYLDVFFSGASAPQNIIGALATQFLQSQTQIRSTEASGDPGASYRAYCGTLQNLPAPYNGLNGKKLRMINRAKGGSGMGVYPIALNASIGIMALDTAVCNVAPSSGYQFVCPESATLTYRPDMGVSDVEPRMFKGPYNLEPDFPDQLTSAQVNALNVSNTFNTQFGFAGNNLVTSTTFSRTEITSILSGRVKRWTNLGLTVAAPAGKDFIHVCRRVSGSGTQATFNAYFNNFPCGVANVVNGGIIAPKGQADSTAQNGNGDGTTPGTAIELDPTLGNIYAENSASGDVRTCLLRADTGVDYTYSVREFDEDLGAVTDRWYKILWSKANTATAPNRWPAVGLLSLDSAGSTGGGIPGNGIVASTTGANWNYKNLEGLVPTQMNAASGVYDFASETTFQYLPAHYTGLTDSANRLLFVQFFTAAAGSESTLDNIAAPTKYAFTANPTKNDIVGGGGAPNCAWSAGGISVDCLTARWTKGGQSCSPAATPQF